jgi:hypothetical protein
VSSIKDTFNGIVEKFKQSIQNSAQETLRDAGAVTPEETEQIIKNGGHVLDPKDPGRDLDQTYSKVIDIGIYRVGIYMVVMAVGILALTRMLPTEQIVKVVKS